MVILFVKEGAKMMLIGRRVKPLEETVSVIKSEGGKAIYRIVDVSKADKVRIMVEEIIKAYGKIDILYIPQYLLVQEKPL